MAKDAAIKSISCEVVENRSGRIVFANSPSAATVLAQTFHLPDKSARGFHRFVQMKLLSCICLLKTSALSGGGGGGGE